MLKNVIGAVLVGLFVPIFSFASSVSTGEYEVDMDVDGSVGVKAKGLDADTDARGGVNVVMDGVDTVIEVDEDGDARVTSGGVDISAMGKGVSVHGEGVAISVDDESVHVFIDEDGEESDISLDAGLAAEWGKIEADDQKVILDLGGNSIRLINGDPDFDLYADMLVESSAEIDDVVIEEGKIVVTYARPAKLFGLFASDIDAGVVVAADGSVAIDLPWYSVFYSEDDESVRASVEAKVNAAKGKTLAVAEVGKKGAKEGLRASARALSLVAEGLKMSFDVKVSTK